ncbi:MAG: transcriptional regulator [Mesorhizobium amorphae]|nr:MAG: transcriptional regulator [Mesorhizobium amorphae]
MSTKTEAERARSEQEALAKQYREIGPASLVAALLCAAKKSDAKREARKAA